MGAVLAVDQGITSTLDWGDDNWRKPRPAEAAGDPLDRPAAPIIYRALVPVIDDQLLQPSMPET